MRSYVTTAAFVRRGMLIGIILGMGWLLSAAPMVSQYQNPLDVSIADPQVLKEGDTYYLYGTTYDAGFGVFSSADMVHWQRRGLAWTPTSTSWAQSDFWAPEVIRSGSNWYLFYTGKNAASGRRNICVAMASSPLGPYVDVTTPIMPPGQSYIDGHPYQDPVSGRIFLYAVEDRPAPSRIVVTELTTPPIARTGAITEVMTVTQPWEGEWVEAPFVVRHNAHYYMMYSGRWFWENEYAVGYATATDLRGPWTKASTNPIIAQTATVSGPGHNSAAWSPDLTELFTFYHTHLNFAGGGQRQLAMDRLTFIPQPGQPSRLALQAGQPTTSLQPLPSGAASRPAGQSDSFDSGVLDRARWNIFGEEPADWKLEYGQLVIKTRQGDFANDVLDARNVFLQYVPPGDFSAETRVTFSATANYEQAFLVLWDDQSNFIRFGCVYANGSKLETGQDVNGVYTSRLAANPWGTQLRLRIQRAGNMVTLYAGAGAGAGWSAIGPPIPFTALQPQIGLGALSPVSGARKDATFDFFNLTYPSAVADWALY